MGNKVKTFGDLGIWQKAVRIAVDVSALPETGPVSRDFGTKDRIRRSAFSIFNNIAEGFEYDDKDFVRFLRFAKGPAGELRSQFFALKETGLLDAIFYE